MLHVLLAVVALSMNRSEPAGEGPHLSGITISIARRALRRTPRKPISWCNTPRRQRSKVPFRALININAGALECDVIFHLLSAR